jgi:hypothetical protein
MGAQIHKKQQDELCSTILKGLRNDLIGFVDDFNKKYKAFKERGANIDVFEEETIMKLHEMVELGKSFPCD